MIASLALTVLLACGFGSSPPAQAWRSVDVSALATALDNGAVPLLVDVRSEAEYAAGHIEGALNVPIDQVDARIAELGPKERELYVVCQSGRRSAMVSASLVKRGYAPVEVTGGTAAWVSAGKPVVK